MNKHASIELSNPSLAPMDYLDTIEICKLVYPTETPCTPDELDDRRQIFPQNQLVGTK